MVHTGWSGPALAVVGVALTVMIISSMLGAQLAFEIVQRNVFCPTPRLVTVEVGFAGVVTVPVPLISDQAPVPTTGVLPASVAVFEQIV